MNHVTITTGGRAARSAVYELLDWGYQDSGLLGALMCGVLDAPDQMPAGATTAGSVVPRGQRVVLMTAPREQQI